MHLRYRTGIATFIQFVAMSLLGIANGVESIISTCAKHSQSCVSNSIPSIIFFMLTVFWFGVIWMLGYLAQERRSRLLAYALIAVELAVIMVASYQIRHHQHPINFITSLVDLCLAGWVIVLAWRLARAKGGRIVATERSRQRRIPKPEIKP